MFEFYLLLWPKNHQFAPNFQPNRSKPVNAAILLKIELQTFKISTFRHFINFSTKQLTSGLLMGSIRFSALKWLLDWSLNIRFSFFKNLEKLKLHILDQTNIKFHSFSSTTNCLVLLIRAWALCIFACTKVASKSALHSPPKACGTLWFSSFSTIWTTNDLLNFFKILSTKVTHELIPRLQII